MGDITFIGTDEGWLYLAVVLDLYSRRVVGWSMGDRMPASLVCDALRMALFSRRMPRGVIMHTDRGAVAHDPSRMDRRGRAAAATPGRCAAHEARARAQGRSNLTPRAEHPDPWHAERDSRTKPPHTQKSDTPAAIAIHTPPAGSEASCASRTRRLASTNFIGDLFRPSLRAGDTYLGHGVPCHCPQNDLRDPSRIRRAMTHLPCPLELELVHVSLAAHAALNCGSFEWLRSVYGSLSDSLLVMQTRIPGND